MQVEVAGGRVHHSFKISDNPDIIQLWIVHNIYVKVSRHAYMKGDEIKISNHPILDSSDVFCVQGD